MSFKISARNALKGTVSSIQLGATTAIVKLKVGDNTLTSSITNEAVESLSLIEGMEAYGIVKASNVLVAVFNEHCKGIRISARNMLKGIVSEIKIGATTAIVKINLECGQSITSSITNSAVEDLELQIGSKVCAIIKSSCVMIGTN